MLEFGSSTSSTVIVKHFKISLLDVFEEYQWCYYEFAINKLCCKHGVKGVKWIDEVRLEGTIWFQRLSIEGSHNGQIVDLHVTGVYVDMS